MAGLESPLDTGNPASFPDAKGNESFPPVNKLLISDCFIEEHKVTNERIQNNLHYFQRFFDNVNFPKKDHYISIASALPKLYYFANENDLKNTQIQYNIVKSVLGQYPSGQSLIDKVLENAPNFSDLLLNKFQEETKTLNAVQNQRFKDYLSFIMHKKYLEIFNHKCLGADIFLHGEPKYIFDRYSLNSNNNMKMFNPEECPEKITENIMEYDPSSSNTYQLEKGVLFSSIIDNDLEELMENGPKKIFSFKFPEADKSINFQTYAEDLVIKSELSFSKIPGQSESVIFEADSESKSNCNSKVLFSLVFQNFENKVKVIVTMRYPVLDKRAIYSFFLSEEEMKSLLTEFFVEDVTKVCDLEYSQENENKMFSYQISEMDLTNEIYSQVEECYHKNCKYAEKKECKFCMKDDSGKELILFNNQCLKKCPDQTYRNTEKSELPNCVECKEDCKRCSEKGCLECFSPKKLKDSECVDECGSGFFEQVDKNVSECLPCPLENCETCEGGSDCNLCKEGFFMVKGSNKCSKVCPKSQYKNSKTRECLNCKKGCEFCSSFDKCDQCLSPLVYNPERKECINKCSQGYVAVTVPNVQHKVCKKCEDQFALTCSPEDPSKPKTCKAGYVLLKSKQICQKKKICPDGFFYVKEENKCRKCPKECTKCEDEKTCTECLHKFKPVEGVCIESCPENQVFVKGSCVRFEDPMCLHCNAADLKCIKCKKGSFLSGDVCVAICPETTFANEDEVCEKCKNNCKTCESALVCLTCKGDTALTNEKTCVETCEEGFFKDCKSDTKTCKKCNPACKTCHGLTEKDCDICEDGYTLNNGVCERIVDCPVGKFKENDKCVDCKKKYLFCEECNETKCLKCIPGFIPKNNRCFKQIISNKKYVNLFKEIQLFDYYTTSFKKTSKSEFTFQNDFSSFGKSFKDFALSFNIKAIRNFKNRKGSYSLNVFKIVSKKVMNAAIEFNISQNKCSFVLRSVMRDTQTLSTNENDCSYDHLKEWKHAIVSFESNEENNYDLSIGIEKEKGMEIISEKIPKKGINIFNDDTVKIVINPDSSGSVFELSEMELYSKNPVSDNANYDYKSKKPYVCCPACESCQKGLCMKCKESQEKSVKHCPADNFSLSKTDYVIDNSMISIRDNLNNIPAKDPYISDRYSLGGFIYPDFKEGEVFPAHKLISSEYQNASWKSIDNIFDIEITSPTTIKINDKQNIPIDEIIPNKFYYFNVAVTPEEIKVYSMSTSDKKIKKGEIKTSIIKNEKIAGRIFADIKINMLTSELSKSFSEMKFYYNNIPKESTIKEESQKKKIDEKCTEYDLKGICYKCIEGLVVRNDQCQEVSRIIKLDDKTFNFIENVEKAFDVESHINYDHDKKITFSFDIKRKDLHAKNPNKKDCADVDKEESFETNPYSKGTDIFNLFSFKDKSNEVHNLISIRNRQKDNDIEILFRVSNNEAFRKVYKTPNEKDFSYMKFMIGIDLVEKKINYFFADKSQNISKVISSKDSNKINFDQNLTHIIIGDRQGKEMNFEAILITFISEYSSEENLKTIELNELVNPIPCDFNCLSCDYLDQNPKKYCNHCYNKKKKKSKSCSTILGGFHDVVFYENRFSKEMQLLKDTIILDSDEYILTNRNNGKKTQSYYPQSTDVYSDSNRYSVSGSIFLYRDEFVNKDIELNVFSLNNFRDKNTYEFKDDLKTVGINFLRMDVVKTSVDQVSCIVRMKYDSTQEVIEVKDFTLNIGKWILFYIRVNDRTLEVIFEEYNESTKKWEEFKRAEVDLLLRPVYVNENTALLKGFGRYVKKLSFGSVHLIMIPRDKFSNTLYLIKKKFPQFSTYKYWDKLPCKQENCSICSQVVVSKNYDDQLKDNICLDCLEEYNIIQGKCNKIEETKQDDDQYKGLVDVVLPGYLGVDLDVGIPKSAKIDPEFYMLSFFFRRNYIENEVENQKQIFLSFGDLKFYFLQSGLSEYVFANMDNAFSDEQIFEITTKDSNSWFFFETKITKHEIWIDVYRLLPNGNLSDKIASSHTGIVYKLRNLQEEKIKINANRSKFTIHTVKVNINKKEDNVKFTTPNKDIISYTYGETMNFDKKTVKSAGKIVKVNNKKKPGFLHPIYDRRQIHLTGKEKLPLIFLIYSFP
jgi:proprotein convertase subtilisin/kexin type 5